MSEPNATPRRVRVERNIYRRAAGKFEVGYKDGAGVQRWRTVDGGITAARALRDDLLARRGRGERVAPNPRLRFSDALNGYLRGPVTDLRPATRELYRNAAARHLLPRFAARRLDAITADDLVELVRDFRAAGLSESSAIIVLGVVNRVYRYAARRLAFGGANPVSLMLPSERPKPSRSGKRRVFVGSELEETIAAAVEPWRTLFILAALTGARLSELCGLVQADLHLDDLDDAEIEFAWQVDRKGHRRPMKTDGSARTIPIPRELAVILGRHRLASRHKRPEAYVFATSSGRPIEQRNVARALRAAQRKAVNNRGQPTFPVLHHAGNTDGGRHCFPHGALPTMHSFRHTLASRGLMAGESVDELAFLLGHSNANVTRAVYIHEVADARRRAMRRSAMLDQFGRALEAATQAGPDGRSQSSSDRRQTRLAIAPASPRSTNDDVLRLAGKSGN